MPLLLSRVALPGCVLLGALLAACAADAEPTGGGPGAVSERSAERAAAGAAPDRLRWQVRATPADPLLGYAWDGRGEIALGEGGITGELAIDYGEPPPARDALLHLGLNAAPGALVDLSPAGRDVDARGVRSVSGRFGRGVAPAPQAVPVLRIPELPPFPEAWTLELWVHLPEAEGRSVLAARAGAFELALDDAGRVLATLELSHGGPVHLRSASPLPRGVWVHLALAVETRVFHHLRLVADGELRWKRLPENAAPGGGRGPLVLGGWDGRAPRFGGSFDQIRLLPRALPSQALLEAGAVLTPRGDHELRLRSRSGERIHELFAFPLRRPVLDGPAELAAGALHLAVADAAGLRPADAHFERIPTGRTPLPRTTHPTIYAGGGQAFVFAGEVRDSLAPPMRNVPDTWLYEIAARRWSRVDADPSPPPRCHQSMAYSPDHDLVLLVGGWHNEGPEKEILSDVWTFHVRERRWEERPPQGFELPAQSDSGVVYHAAMRRFLVFRHAEIYEYDPERDRWSRRPEPRVTDADGRPARLGGRTSPIMGYDPETRLVLRFGGAVRAGRHEAIYTDTTALYDADANAWTVLKPGPRPAPRVRGALAYDERRRRFTLFGGVRDQFSKRYDDLWSFDTRTRRWTRHVPSNTPSPRGGFYGMAYDPELDVFVVAAGRHSHRLILDETWHLRFGERSGRATYVFDRAAFAPAAEFFAVTHEPPGTSVRLGFAGSPDGADFGAPAPTPGAMDEPDARFVRVELELERGAAPDAVPRVLALGFGAPGPDAAHASGAARVRRLAASPYPGAGR